MSTSATILTIPAACKVTRIILTPEGKTLVAAETLEKLLELCKLLKEEK